MYHVQPGRISRGLELAMKKERSSKPGRCILQRSVIGFKVTAVEDADEDVTLFEERDDNDPRSRFTRRQSSSQHHLMLARRWLRSHLSR